MKATIFILALVAVRASVAYAAPEDYNEEQAENAEIDYKQVQALNAEIEALLEKQDASQQDDDDDKRSNELLAEMQGEEDDDEKIIEILAQMQEDDDDEKVNEILAEMQGEDDDEEENAALQEFFAREQVPAKLQGWFKRVVRRVGRGIRRFVKKAIPVARRLWKAYQCYKG